MLTNKPCTTLTGSPPPPFSGSSLNRAVGGSGSPGPQLCRFAAKRHRGLPPLSRFPCTGSRGTNAPTLTPRPQAAGWVCGGGGGRTRTAAPPIGRARLNCPHRAAGGGGWGPRLLAAAPGLGRTPLESPAGRH